jgi:hypothetical protein
LHHVLQGFKREARLCIDALADALRGRDASTVDDVPAQDFWDLVREHELPDLPEEPSLALMQLHGGAASRRPRLSPERRSVLVVSGLDGAYRPVPLFAWPG